MRLEVSDTNFFINSDNWIFKLKDDQGASFYILTSIEYSKLNIKSPITKRHLDFYDKGVIINAEVRQIDSKNIVIAILD